MIKSILSCQSWKVRTTTTTLRHERVGYTLSQSIKRVGLLVSWLLCVSIFSSICSNVHKHWKKIVLSISTGVVYVLGVLCISNIPYFLDWKAFEGTGNDFRMYLEFIWYDLIQGVRIGKYSCIIFFIVTAIVCLGIAHKHLLSKRNEEE